MAAVFISSGGDCLDQLRAICGSRYSRNTSHMNEKLPWLLDFICVLLHIDDPFLMRFAFRNRLNSCLSWLLPRWLMILAVVLVVVLILFYVYLLWTKVFSTVSNPFCFYSVCVRKYLVEHVLCSVTDTNNLLLDRFSCYFHWVTSVDSLTYSAFNRYLE